MPDTLYERTETQQPREWQAGDVPDGDIMAYGPVEMPDAPDGVVRAIHRVVRRVQAADALNNANATHILVLPEVLP